MPSDVGLIWAQTRAGVIGRDGAIPWQLPEDIAHFKAVTMGHPVVMGRKTWDSLPQRFRPLTGRRNIVVTRQDTWTADGAETVGSLADALALTEPDKTWVIGGGELYTAAISFAHTLSVTEIDADIDGDAFAPAIGPEWSGDDAPWLTSTGGLRYRFVKYDRAT